MAAVQLDPSARAAVELLQLCRDEAKESLVTAEGEDMYRSQGAARFLNRLVTEIMTPPAITRS